MTDGGIVVRLAQSSDADNIAAAEQAYIDCPWSVAQVKAEINSPDATFVVAEVGGVFAGYLSGVVAAGECELSNIAVAESFRRRGVAKRLFKEFFDLISARGAETVFLLVRDDNTAAISLYGSLGFSAVGSRKNYYQGRSAVVMRKDLK